MRTAVWSQLGDAERRALLARPPQRDDPRLLAEVTRIVDRVRAVGWRGLCEIAAEIDGEEPRRIEVAPFAAHARATFSPEQVEALELAARNIRTFHEASRPADISVETMPGLTVRKIWRPIDRVGIYVPGGKTPLFSTLLMLALPARAAGVDDIVAVTPPRFDGGLDPAVALAAELCGIDEMWTVGGAQAIAALAFGAGDIAPVDKICGPGNAWVAAAKRLVSSAPGGPAIDMPAGPSELMVIADDSADPELIAADLLSQAEHDPSAQVILVGTSSRLVGEVIEAVESQLATLPRSAIARQSLESARLILVEDQADAIDIANLYAPEHLSLAVADWEALLPRLRNAGAIFAGPLCAETFGDYLAGSSHVLPTDGAARAWGGLSVLTFLKAISVQSATPDAARRIATPAALLARMEALEAHARAADARLEYLA